jgi:alkylation response protein AidB-like acyl-CoA dehydrogenase
MNLPLTFEQIQFKDTVDRFAAAWCADGKQQDRTFSRATWQQLADLGWLGAGLSEMDGGIGGGPIETMLIMEAVGRSLMQAPFLPVMVHATKLLLAVGQEVAAVAGIIAGQNLLTIALDEPAAHRSGNPTILNHSGDGFVLSGRKRLVPFGVQADGYLVSAKLDKQQAIVRVSATAHGVSATGYPTIDGHGAADVSFVNASVPVEGLVAIGSRAENGLVCAEQFAITALCAEAVGIAQFLYESTLDYVKQRQQFGQPIGRFQVIQHRLVDMLVAVEEARSLALMASTKVVYGGSAEAAHAIAAAKLGVLSRAMHVARESIQLHGGIGMTESLPLGAGLRRLKALNATYGDEGTQLNRMRPGILTAVYV